MVAWRGSVLGGNEMAHRQHRRELFYKAFGAGQIMRRQSEPVHAGVYMHRGGMTHTGPAAEIGPFNHFGQRAEHRNEFRLRIDL